MHWISIKLKFPPFEKEHGLQKCLGKGHLSFPGGYQSCLPMSNSAVDASTSKLPQSHQVDPDTVSLASSNGYNRNPNSCFFLNSFALGWSPTKMHHLPTIYHLITFLSTSAFDLLGKKTPPETIRNTQCLVSSLYNPSDIQRTDHRCNILTLEFDDRYHLSF